MQPILVSCEAPFRSNLQKKTKKYCSSEVRRPFKHLLDFLKVTVSEGVASILLTIPIFKAEKLALKILNFLKVNPLCIY